MMRNVFLWKYEQEHSLVTMVWEYENRQGGAIEVAAAPGLEERRWEWLGEFLGGK